MVFVTQSIRREVVMILKAMTITVAIVLGAIIIAIALTE